MNNSSEEQLSIDLLIQISLGQQSALDAFYCAHESCVYRYALNRLNDSLEAASILNEVMMEVWKCAGRFEQRSKVSTWLLGITHHKVHDMLRKRNHRRLEDNIDDLSTKLIDDNQIDMEKVLSEVDDADMVRHCINKLSDSHREVIHLAFFEDLRYQEIASIVRCPEGTVKTRIYHAKQALKKHLVKYSDALQHAC